jgi:hypothetical protein
MKSLAAGLAFRMVDWRRLRVEIAGEVRLGTVRVESRGSPSGGELRVDKRLQGVGFGLDASWSPWSALPLAIEAGFTTGEMHRRENEELIDGYSPFEDGFDVRRLRIGVAWRGRR